MSKASEYAKAQQMVQPLLRFGQPYSEGRVVVDHNGNIAVVQRDHMTINDVVVTIPKEDADRLIDWLKETFID